MNSLEFGILFPAFLAGLLVLATHVPMGQQVLNRGIVFIDLAIAQVAGLGVTAADTIGLGSQGWQVQVAAGTAALLGALVLTWTERKWPDVQEALIGVLFILSASVELLVLANNPRGGEHLKDLLVGQILWVVPSSLWPTLVLYAAVLVAWFLYRARLGQIGFYVLFALVVTQSVQLVGIYLVFTSLIVPALAARLYPERIRLAVGYAVGVVGYVSGLIASSIFDLPTGAVIVVTLAITFAITTMLARGGTVSTQTEPRTT